MPNKSLVNRPPAYSRQREKGRADRAYVWHDGKKVMLGRYDSPESRAKYNAMITGQPAGETDVPVRVDTDPTVSELIVAYLEYAATYYQKSDGTPSGEYESYVITSRWLRRESGSLPAKKFGPKRLKQLREKMIDAGWSRKTINDRVQRVRRMFKWGASEEMFPAEVPQALDTVENLHQGRSKAKETRPVRPVADADVEATLKHLPSVVADMVRLQRLTGCRPGELIIMRPCDVNRTGEVWLYKPSQHKTAYRGHGRAIAIGPKAQAVLLRYLVRDSEAFCFRPIDSEAARLATQHENRKTPLSCGNRRGTNCKGTSRVGEVYTVHSYRRAIERAAKKAGVERWTPHRLRHTAATEVRRQFGLDAAQSLLGHKHASVSEIYAELNTAKASDIARRIG